MRVYRVEAVIRCCVVLDGIFLYFILDLLAAVLVFWEIFERVCPLISFGYFLACDLNVICDKTDGDAVGAYSVTVVIVFPRLEACNERFLGLVYVRYGVAVDLGVIIGDGIFLYRILDKLAAVTVYR